MDGGWSMDREKGVEYKLLNELFTRMQYEQTVLMFGNKYRRKISRLVKELRETGKIVRIGSARKGFWQVK